MISLCLRRPSSAMVVARLCSRLASANSKPFAEDFGHDGRMVTWFLFANCEQFYIENQHRIGWDHAEGSASHTSQFGSNSQLPFPSNLHSRYSFIPAPDDPPGA